MPESAPPALPYGRQLVEEDDIAAVAAVLRGAWLTTGPASEAFEAALAAKVGARFAVSCSSGTAGLHLAALALGLGSGDAVVVPTVTFLATANAARFVGAEVIFADVDADTGLMGPDHLRAALARSEAGTVKAVFPVHLNGQCADAQGLAAVAAEHGLGVVEDASHALGAACGVANGAASGVTNGAASGVASGVKDDLAPVGDCRHADMAVFSFHPVKAVTMGEGGAVTTNDARLAERLRSLRNHGIHRNPAAFENRDLAFDDTGAANPWYYEMGEIGYNYRASDIACALGHSQLGKLDRFIARRRALAGRYDSLLAALAPAVHPVARAADCAHAWHLYPVLIDFASAGTSRAAVMKRLGAGGIATQVHYLPAHLQPYYRRRYGERDLPGAARYYQRVLSLPLFPAMGDGDPARVVAALAGALGLSANVS